jgi:hypothetical protein
VRAEQAGSGQPDGGLRPPGQSGRGAALGRTRTVVTEAVRAIAGTGRSSSTATQATAAVRMTAPAISRHDRSLRPRPAPPGRRPARRERNVLPLTARGRNSLRRMTHHRNNDQPPGPARLQQPDEEAQQLHCW